MFRFFKNLTGGCGVGCPRYYSGLHGFQVEIDVKINEWFGRVHDMIQSIGQRNSIILQSIGEVYLTLSTLQVSMLLLQW